MTTITAEPEAADTPINVRPARVSARMHDRDLPSASPFIFRLFAKYTAWYLRRHMNALRVRGFDLASLPTDRPVVLYVNHPSWWDPLVGLHLAYTQLHHRQHFAPIDAAMLEKYGFFKKLGFFGVEQDSPRGGVRFLRTAIDLLDDPASCLWITAQGRFTDVRERPVRLRPGLAHLLRRRPEVTVVPIALEYTHWTEKQPEALVQVGEPFVPAEVPVEVSSREVSARCDLPQAPDRNSTSQIAPDGASRAVDAILHDLEARMTAVMDDLAEKAIARDAAAFRTLLDGAASVSLVWDTWRRAKAWAAGAKFNARHGEA